MITLAATVLALFAFASHGGPTFITLGVAPVLYAIAVRDLKSISWSKPTAADDDSVSRAATVEA